MTSFRRPAKIGLFADGPVGEAVLATVLEHYPDHLAYVVTPTSDSPLAKSRIARSMRAALYDWSVDKRGLPLPSQAGCVPDIVFLAWWPHIVRRDFLSAGQFVTLNMHPSLLPCGRGKDPNFWTLVKSDPFGVTIHHVDEGVDTGPIAFQARLETDWTDTGGSLYAKAQAGLIALFRESLDAIMSLEIPRIPQSGGIGRSHRRADLAPRSKIDLDAVYTGRNLLNLLRARTSPPHPGCQFTDRGETYQIRIEIEKIEDQL